MRNESAASDVPDSDTESRPSTTDQIERLDLSKLLIARLVDVCAVGTSPNDLRFQLLLKVGADQPVVFEMNMQQVVAMILANDRILTRP